MKLSQYGYDFAPEMLAKHPTENRDDSRLMVIDRAKGTIEHRIFKDIIEYFDEKDLFVFNDTKVFPARLYGNKEKTGAEIEIFLLRELNRELRLWDVLVDPARKIRIGNKLYFGGRRDGGRGEQLSVRGHQPVPPARGRGAQHHGGSYRPPRLDGRLYRDEAAHL